MQTVETRRSRVVMGRPPEKQAAILGQLRGHIVSGQWAPGSRLPNRQEIERSFSASPITVQRALDQLVSDGFVSVRGKLGSFVADEPPHLNNIAVVFPVDPAKAPWTGFNAAFENEVARLNQSGARRMPLYVGVDAHTDTPGYRRLVDDMENHRLAGIIFAFSPEVLGQSVLIREDRLPRVAFSGSANVGWHNVSTSPQSFLTRALAHVAAAGRTRVAFLNPNGLYRKEHLDEALEQHDLRSHSYWRLRFDTGCPAPAEECTELLFHEGQSERPDALIISDDNLVAAATAGVVAAGIRDLTIVAHSNFPHPAKSHVPVTRLGFDTRKVLQSCLGSIDAQRRGDAPARTFQIKACFEDELESRPNQDRESS